MTFFKFIFLYCAGLFMLQHCTAQQTDTVSTLSNKTIPDSSTKYHIASIVVTGNKKTKSYIILREIPFKNGDSLSSQQLPVILEQARRQVYNINLFSEVSITPELIATGELILHIAVKEKWYLYPTPQFQLVDRNFNEWLKTYNADLNRVVYGVKFVHYNFSGRGDQLRIYLLNGYARNISFNYSTPYSNSALSEGFRVAASYTQNREISYKTTFDNKLLDYRKTGFIRNSLALSLSYQVRSGFFKRHFFTLAYNYIKVQDSILDTRYNPYYLNNGSSSSGFFDLAYTFQYQNTDNINYPLTGQAYRFSVLKRGTGFTGGINMLSFDGSYNKYLRHRKSNWYSSIQFYGKIKAPFTLAYINQRALGYGDVYLRGLEYYVIDGAAAAVAKYTLKRKLFSFNIAMPFHLHLKSVRAVPFTIFAKAYTDQGYSYAKNEFDTRLNNRFLYTGGFGLDVLSLYDVNLGLEYSFNQLNENGLFLHAKIGF